MAPQNAVILPAGNGVPWQTPGNLARPPAPSVAAAQPQRPIIRAQMGEEPRSTARSSSTPVTLPTPEQLGLSAPAAKDGKADWTAAHRRLDRLGAVSFQVQKLPEGNCRFVCLLPTDQPNYNHRVEVEAATEAEAVRLGLDRAESWTRQR
jgi:hypothetical protein